MNTHARRGQLHPAQQQALARPIDPKRVLKDGKGMSHLSQQDVTAHLTRILGYGNYDVEIVDLQGVFEHPRDDKGQRFDVCYRARVRLTIRNTEGETVAVYEDVSTATAQNQKRGDAHDLAAKGLSLDTILPTPNGWTTMGDIKEGDYVFDRDGAAVKVMDKSEVKNLPCYEVTFQNGHSITCDDEHLWVATVAQEKERTHAIADLYEAKQQGKRVVLPMAKPLDLPEVPLPLDPWVLGYWLGNGNHTKPTLHTHGEDRVGVAEMIRSAGIEVGVNRHVKEDRNAGEVSMVGGIGKVLVEMGVHGHKHIPTSYMRASFNQRLALLRGLMDSDGTIDRTTPYPGRVTFSSTDPRLARDVAELARSIGERVWSSEAITGHGFGKEVTYYLAQWKPTVNPFALDRKGGAYMGRDKISRHIVKSIEKVESVPTACIAVDSPTRTYLASEFMVPTHNSAVSLAKKRCAINLGDGYGLALYNKGQVAPLVAPNGQTLPMWLAAQDSTGEESQAPDMQDGVPEQVSMGDVDPESEVVQRDPQEVQASLNRAGGQQ